MSWLIPRSELTPDQERAITLGADEHRAVVGGPGSGKTQILLYRAQHLARKYGIGPESYRVFVYTNVLKDYIQSALPLLDLPSDNVLTFDHWCRLFYERHINRRLPWDARHKMPDFALMRSGVAQAIERGAVRLPMYDFVLVDEGQDLPDRVYRVLSRVSRHITVCLDRKQQIYDTGSAEEEVLTVLGLRRRNMSLIDAFRVCPYLVKLAAEFIPDPDEKQAFINQARQPQTEKQTPYLHLAGSADEELSELYRVVRERQMKNDRIAILYPQVRQVMGYARRLRDAGIEVEVPPRRWGKSEFPAHDFNSSRPKLMPYHSVKGLTFDTVIMPRLTRESFGRFLPERIERLLFVGITRATRWAFLQAPANNLLPSLAGAAEKLRAEGVMHVSGGGGAAAYEKADGDGRPGEDDLDFL